MKKLPKISIVIPSYNKAEFVQETLDSVISQNYPNLEVIIQDGGSTDGTVDIIKEFAKRYPKEISWVSKKDKGQVDAINRGLKKATGDVVTYINADDVYEEGCFKAVADCYCKNLDALWFASRGPVIDEKGKEIAKPITAYKNFLLLLSSYTCLLSTNYLMQPSIFLTKGAYKKYGPFTGTDDFVMEYDLWLKIGKEKMPVVINKNLAKFRIEPSTKTKTLFADLLKQDELIVNKYTKNKIILFFHKFHNILRVIIGRWFV
jgi:glycosyltransferase involved in cell wall biosynthesis